MTSTPATTQVLIVGGGPAGSSTAWHLARLGLDVVLVDRARFPRDKPCAEYLSPEASRVLAAMGVLPAIDAAGAAHLTGMLIEAPSGATIRGEFAASHGFRGFRDSGLALPRMVLDALLLDAARGAGVTVVEGAKVEQLLYDAGHVCGGAEIRVDGEVRTIRSRVVVGADGLRSIVSRRLGLAHTHRWPRRYAFVAHYRGVSGMTSAGEMHVRRDGYLGLADVGNGLTNVALVMPRALGQSLASSPDAMLSDWIALQPTLARRFRNAEQIGKVKSTGPFASHARRAWAPGAALVGDAADFFDPFTGEGIYAALRGGELLAPHVHDAVSTPHARQATAALAAYDTERRATFAGKWRVEKVIGLSVACPWLLERAAGVLQHDPDLADLLVGVAGDFVPPSELLRPRVFGRLLRRLYLPDNRIRALPQHAHRS
jgi:flavin-dependent dehydrogenase